MELQTLPDEEIAATNPSEELTLLPSPPSPVVAGTNFDRVASAVFADVSPGSQRVYGYDVRQFARWLIDWELTIETVGYLDLKEYKAWLLRNYSSKATIARKFVVARRLVQEASKAGFRSDDPTTHIKGIRVEDNGGTGETPHRALTRNEARTLLAAVDTSTLRGKRDYALLSLLIRTGLRRAEAAALTLGDLKTEQGHHIIRVRHGKGDKPRTVKLPVDVLRHISDYLEATGRKQSASADQPLFVHFRRGDKPQNEGMSDKGIEQVVKGYAQKLNLDGLTPHGLRASFVTLALEGGAKLEQVQYAAGHSDPRTTERYQRRKLNLDDHAVDYLKL